MSGTKRGINEQLVRFEELHAQVLNPGGDECRAVAVAGDSLRIGRDAEMDLVVVGDSAVSSRHCVIISTAEGWVLRDQSTNGTRVDGLRVRELMVDRRIVIMVGNTKIEINPKMNAVHKSQVIQPHGIIGSSSKMLSLFNRIDQVSSAAVSVMLLGETGTGKELVARAIHNARAQKLGRRGKFIVIDCTNIPHELAESMLQGHTRGAFTGASTAKPSPFEVAEGGTVFMDEIGDLPLALQGKLLRTIQEREVTPVGSHEPKKIDILLITATHRNITKMVTRGEFRADLYYRIHDSEICLPPLRDRGRDIVELAEYFISDFCATTSRESCSLSEGAIEALLNARWPGNVRQLESTLRSAIFMNPHISQITSSELLDASQNSLEEDALTPSGQSDLFGLPWKAAEGEFAHRYWTHLHAEYNGKIKEIAEHTKLSEPAVRSRLRNMVKD